MSSFSRLLLRRCFSTSQTPTTKPQSDPGIVKTLSTSIFRDRNLKRVVEKFKKSSEIDRFRTKSGIYENTIHRLASAKRFEWVEEILEDQKKYDNISNEGFNARLIALYGKAGMFGHASKVFDEMPERNCPRTVLSFNALLGACVSAKEFDKLGTIFEETPSKLSITPDVYSYNTLIKGLCGMGNFDEALGMLDEMERRGLKPDLVTFNTLLSFLYENRFTEAEEVWDRMVSSSVFPDVRSYNAKIVGYSNRGMFPEAMELVNEMESKGIEDNLFTHNALLKGMRRHGDLELSLEWLKKMPEIYALSPDKVSYATVISTACDMADSDQALDLCNKAFEQKCFVLPSVLQGVVNKLVEDSKIEEAKKLVESVKSNKHCRVHLVLPSEKPGSSVGDA